MVRKHKNLFECVFTSKSVFGVTLQIYDVFTKSKIDVWENIVLQLCNVLSMIQHIGRSMFLYSVHHILFYDIISE